MTLIATESSEVLMCDAWYFSIISTLVRQFFAIMVDVGTFHQALTDVSIPPAVATCISCDGAVS